MEIDKITLKHVLPRVFAGMETEPQIAQSQVWLKDIAFEREQFYIIEAESGNGKSSLCSFIYGNRRDYSGEILFNDRDIRTLSIDEWCEVRRRSIAILPQEMRLFPELTTLENIQLKNKLTSHLSETEIMDMLSAFGIANKAHVAAAKLSVGQQQRAAIVRALCQPFSFILLDEPVSHLDERNNRIAAELIAEQARKQQAAILTTSVGNPLLLPDAIHIKL